EGLTLDAEYRLVGRDGKVIWVHDTAVPVRDEDGVPCYWQGYAINISERRAIESPRDRLLTRERAQNERLRELDRVKAELVALVSVVRGCVEAAEPVAAQSRVELLAECGEVPSLSGDPARLAQLVDNLLSNAIKFTPADGRVSVRVAHSNGVAVLEVADTGP